MSPVPRVLRSLPVRLVLVGAVLVLALGASSCGSPPMKPTDGRLPDCPGSPNCVNSMDTDASRHVAPLSFDGDPEAALDRLQEVLLAMPRTTLVEREPGYLHVTFRSMMMELVGYIDANKNYEKSDLLQILRILQEAITNTIKHAGARHIIIELAASEDDETIVRVIDDGKGLSEPKRAGGRGLLNMQRRARDIGARIEFATSARNGGTCVTLCLPHPQLT